MGEQLGPYLLDKRIGAGGMADVFLAKGPRGVCVVKRPHAHLCANPEFVRMFLDEASLLARLHHPGIAQIYDLGHVRGVPYLAMEYVPGFDLMTISLEHERQGELIAPELCARIVGDVAAALHAAHEATGADGQPMHLVHRDVTPHNILLSTSGEVKLIDFGVARVNTSMHRTQAGFVKGKYPYMSPEQITGQVIDRRVDVYALGLVLYELLTNVRAIAGNTEVEQIDNARSSRIRPIEQLRPNVSTPLRQIIASCIYPEPAGRYPTALAVKEDLEKYLTFERHVVGREDLLRLFRVVAAEVGHTLGPVPEVQASRPTEREQPISLGAVVVPESGAPDDSSLIGVSPTVPSMKMPAVSPPEPPTLPPDRGDLARNLGALAARAPTPPPVKTDPAGVRSVRALKGAIGLVAVLLVGVTAAVVMRSSSERGAVDAGVAVVDANEVPEKFVFPDVTPDAGAAVALAEPDAGPLEESVDAGLVASPFVDAGVVAPVLKGKLSITCEPESDVYFDKKSVGRTPVDLTAPAGPHTLSFSNQQEHFGKVMQVRIEGGVTKTIAVEGRKGTLHLEVTPAAMVKIDGVGVGMVIGAKSLPLYEGSHSLELEVAEGSKKRQVMVRPGQDVSLRVDMTEK
jgi:serine/threonine-protein kinase